MNYYNSITENTSTKQLTLEDFYKTVKNGYNGIKEICINIRKYDKYKKEDKAIQGELKKGLPVIHIPMSQNNPTKTLKNISKDALSGFVYFDIDNIPNIQNVKEELSKHAQISMVWYSASGTGLGVIVACEWVKDLIDFTKNAQGEFEKDLNEQYKQITKYIWDSIGLSHIEIDPNANRINQVNYISYDSETHYNPNAKCTVAKPDNSIIKITKLERTKQTAKTTNQAPTSILSNLLAKDILDGLVADIESDEKDFKVWESSASGTSAINLLTSRAIQYGIDPKDVLVYMQKYTIHSDKAKVYNLKEAESWLRGALYTDNFKKQLYTYSPNLNALETIKLPKDKYLADVFDYKLFKNSDNDNIKAVIIASKHAIHNGNNVLRYPSSIQKFNCEVGSHPTQKPTELMEYLIKTYTNEGDMVLDNTMGSGTTNLACIKLNRKSIGVEKEKQYYDIAVRRASEYCH